MKDIGKYKGIVTFCLSNIYLLFIFNIIAFIGGDFLGPFKIYYLVLTIVILILTVVSNLRLSSLTRSVFRETITIDYLSLKVNISALVLNLIFLGYYFLLDNMNIDIVLIINTLFLLMVFILKSNAFNLNLIGYAQKRGISYAGHSEFERSLEIRDVLVDSKSMLFSGKLNLVSKNINRDFEAIEAIVGSFDLMDPNLQMALKSNTRNLVLPMGEVHVRGKNHTVFIDARGYVYDFILCDEKGAARLLKNTNMSEVNFGAQDIYVLVRVNRGPICLAFKYQFRILLSPEIVKALLLNNSSVFKMSFTSYASSNSDLLKLEQKIVNQDVVDVVKGAALSSSSGEIAVQLDNQKSAITIKGDIPRGIKSYKHTLNINYATGVVQRMLIFQIVAIVIMMLSISWFLISDILSAIDLKLFFSYILVIVFGVFIYISNVRFRNYNIIGRQTLIARSILKSVLLGLVYFRMYDVNYDLESCWFAFFTSFILCNLFDLSFITQNVSSLAKTYGMLFNISVAIIFIYLSYGFASNQVNFIVNFEMMFLILASVTLYVLLSLKYLEKWFRKYFNKG